MNRTKDDRQDSPETISAQYRLLATEQAPDHLDRAVLCMANKEVTEATKTGWWIARIRPLAFVVTAGLSLALLIQLNHTPVLETIPLDPGIETLPDNVFQDAARQTAEQIEQLNTDPGRSMNSSGTAMNPVQATERPAGLSLLPIEDRCTDTDRAESGTWWECIRDLEKRGLSESAELELQALLNAHPQFSDPR